MKILILGPFPVRKFFGNVLRFSSENFIEHPAPWIVNLIILLKKRPNYEIHIVTLNSQLRFDTTIIDQNTQYHIIKGTPFRLQAITFFIYDILKIIKEIKNIKPDVIESFGTEGPYSIAAILTKYPTVIYIQGIISELFKETKLSNSIMKWTHYFFTQFIERFTIRKADLFIVENSFPKNFVRKINPKAKIFIIPNLINPQYFNTNIDHSIISNNLIFIGSVSEKKGILDLIDSISIIIEKYPDCKLFIGGRIDSGFHDLCQKRIENLNIRSNVFFLGLLTVTEIIQLYEKFPIFIHPSWMDTSPNSLLEAMVAGLPVIATEVGGIPDIIDNGVNGLLVEAKSPTMLAERIIYLLSNPSIKIKLGENAKKQSRELLDHRNILNRTELVYRKAIERD